MKKPLTLLGLALLTACSSSAPQTNNGNNDQDTIPYVPRSIASSYPCPSGTASAAATALNSGFGPFMQDRGNLIRPRFEAQTTSGNSVWDLLYDTKVLINQLYFGYSAADLQALHDQAYQNFKKTFPQALSTYTITSQVDDPMNTYLNSIGDPHTYYLSAAELAAFNDQTSGTPQATPVFGIFSWPVAGGDGTLVNDVRGESSAFGAGLRRGDVILSVDGVPLKRSVQPKVVGGVVDDSEQAALYTSIISSAAKKQTPVPVVVRRGSVQRSVNLSGQVLSATLLPWGELKTDASGNKVYYLRIPSFNGSGIGQKVHDLVNQALALGARGLVVDLRNDTGGQLIEFVAAAGAFASALPSANVRFASAQQMSFSYAAGMVSYQQSCQNAYNALSLKNPALWTGKVAILLNGLSASASEMFSQTLHLGAHTTLIGEQTYGVGNTVTGIYQTPNSGISGGADGAQAISITAGRMYFDNQVAPASLLPDISVPDDETALAASGVDTALQQAFATLR